MRATSRAKHQTKDGIKSGLAAHIEPLLAEHAITVGIAEGYGRAFKRDRHVLIPVPQDAVSYLIALHEIGRIVRPTGSGRGLNCLGSYVRRALRVGTMRLPSDDHPFSGFTRSLRSVA